ncbi:thiamine phosphate synthase [Alteromonas halophila]|uniref:Thiamine-phosphate synthase n=1 Tax=Alteromonas halophila TaxID=516698 RepID=A0A918JH30_9ALTE|nr:thiamine phosphate synthase [Alteromonas halophila]GGW81159.1 bifunctional hydroxy-(phospho)methylpyrimidine kinase/thiamine-phosphate pyrophosphorylase ThiDE [Alteromonas halophila]
MSRPVVWSIAGSDSGGGAGIQADLHTLQALGVHGCTVVTTVTAQNSIATRSLHPLTGEQLHSQLCCLLDDLPPAAIKIGLISNRDQLSTVASFMENWPAQIPRPFVVWDPVLVSTQKDVLSELQPEDITALLRQVNLITPNLSELTRLSERKVASDDALIEAALSLCRQGATAILVTGIASNEDKRNSVSASDNPCRRDYLVSDNDQFVLEKRAIDTAHDHGTGCTLSSAIAAFAAHHYPLDDCLVLASAYVTQGLQQATGQGQGPGPVAHTGWPDTLTAFPAIRRSELPAVSPRFASLTAPPGLYPVVDSVPWLVRLLDMGVTTLQLRIKAPPTAQVEVAIREAIALGKQYNAQVFINDHWTLAIKHGAFGVHLGQEDLALADLTAIEKAGLRLGISTHSYTEILIALRYSPSYIALGHIFPTQTKSMPSLPQGVERLARYVKLLTRTGIPAVAIGGIGLSNIDEVVQANPDGVAVVTAITQSENVREAVAALKEKLDQKPTGCASREVSDAH